MKTLILTLSLLLFTSAAIPQEKNPDQNQIDYNRLLAQSLTCNAMNEEFTSRMTNFKEMMKIIGQTPPPVIDRLLEQAKERDTRYSAMLSAILGEIMKSGQATEEALIDYITEFRIGIMIGFKKVGSTDTFISNLSKILLECDEMIGSSE